MFSHRNSLKVRRNLRGLTLVEAMVAVSIVGMLASVAIPVFQTYIYRAKQAEVPMMVKRIGDSEIAFFLRPREDQSGTSLVPCYLWMNGGGLRPRPEKQDWEAHGVAQAIENARTLGFGGTSPVYFSYWVGQNRFPDDTFDSASAIEHYCETPLSVVNAAAANETRLIAVQAIGNLDGLLDPLGLTVNNVWASLGSDLYGEVFCRNRTFPPNFSFVLPLGVVNGAPVSSGLAVGRIVQGMCR